MSKKPQSITVIGRRWFQKTYGNTYNTVQIFLDGELAADLPIEYGYEDYYAQRSDEWLLANNILPLDRYDWGGVERASYYCRENGIAYTQQAIDVSRKRDL